MVEIFRRLIVTGLALGAIAGNADKIEKFFEETVSNAQHLATASDLRSISNMLDYHFMRTGRYPRPENFKEWMRTQFKESHMKELGVDHWNQPLVYLTDSKRKSFVLVSFGPDGLKDTVDDLRVTGP